MHQKLLVFVQTVIKQRALQVLLQEALPGFDVTAVGRVADFERGIGEAQDAVLTLPVVMRAHGMVPVIRGKKGGKLDETYALVGVEKTPSVADIRTVGAIEMLDRAGTNALVQETVGKSVKVERVTKVEDLLPLLQLSRADAVLVPSRMLPDIRKTSSLPLSHVELAKRIDLPALAASSPAGKPAAEQAAARLGGRAAELLGVDAWQ